MSWKASRPLPMKPANHVALIGPRGAGKTTIAPLLAAKWAWPWLDLDAELERRTGKTIALLLAEFGEPAFRNLESAILSDVLAREPHILATGGGVILKEENRRRLRDRAFVVYLRADPATLQQRLHEDRRASQRPPLTALPEADEVAVLLAEREPLYQATANLIVDTAHRSPIEITHELCEHLRPWICTI